MIPTLPPGAWRLRSAARIEPADPPTLGRVSRFVLRLVRHRTGSRTDYAVFLTLARLGRIFPVHTVLVARLLGRTRLPGSEKELAILRAAWRLGCAYEWSHHRHIAGGQHGVTSDQIADTSSEAPPVGTRVGEMLLAVDELIAEHGLSDESTDRLRRWLSDDEILELAFIVGHYVMVATVINTAAVQLEPEFAVHLQSEE